MSARPRRLLLDPWLLGVSIVWGSNFVVYKFVLRELTPLAIVGFRFGLVALVLGLASLLFPPSGERRPVRWRAFMWAGIFVMGGQQIVFVLGLSMCTVYLSALLTSTAPIFTAVIAALSGQEKLTRVNWVGVALGFAGAAAVVLGGAHNEAGGSTVLGVSLLMLSAFLYGYFMVLARPLVLEHGGVWATSRCYLLSCLLILPVCGHSLAAAPWRSLDVGTWLALAGWIGLLAGAAGFLVWYTMVGRVGSSATAVYQYLVPVVAMVTAAIFLGERPEVLQLAGAVVTLAGLVLSRWPAGLASA